MAVNLKSALRKKLEVKETFGDTYKFENPGDQIVFKFLQRKTIEKTKLGKPGDLVECQILAGEKVDKTTEQISEVNPGPGSFFLGTHLRELFDKDTPLNGDICQVQFVKIGNNNFHSSVLRSWRGLNNAGSSPCTL